MRSKGQLLSTPSFRFNTYTNRYELWLEGDDRNEDISYGCEITYAWDGEEWSHYKFFAFLDGERYEVVTGEQYSERVQLIRDHEGDEEAEKWQITQKSVMVERDDHHVFLLAKHWDALMRLKLFIPAVTH